MGRETRRGVIIMATLSLVLQLVALALREPLGLGEQYTYTFSLLALLSAHIIWSARNVNDVKVMHLLGMILLVVTGAAFMLLAHQTGTIGPGLIAGMVLLFIAMPLVPWGLRETGAVVLLIYTLFSLSANSVAGRFDTQSLWMVQFLIISSSLITIVLIARNVYVRKNDIQARFDLERARRDLELQSLKDPLTGAWNRRFLEKNFLRIAQHCLDKNVPLRVALLDIDDFKMINDTYGHHFADRILEKLSRIFMHLMKDRGFMIRIGGDEFQIIYMGDGLGEIMDRGLRILQNDHELLAGANGNPVQISVGYASVEKPEHKAMEMLYRQADTQLYQAKRINKGLKENGKFTDTISLATHTDVRKR